MSGLGTQDTPAWVPTGVTAWAALTPYVAGAVVTNGGKVYEANATFTSGASFNAANWTQLGAQDGTFVHTSPNSYTPEQYGAVGNNAVHDDAPGIEAAITAAITAAISSGTYSCEVVFDPTKIYYVLRDPAFNATIANTVQIAVGLGLPAASGWQSDSLVTLTLRSAPGPFPYQFQGQLIGGGVIYCPNTGYSWDAVNGKPSCMFGGSRQSNKAPLIVVIDGITTMQPANASLTDFDLAGTGGMHIKSLCTTSIGTGFSTHPNAVGLYMPELGNYGVVSIDHAYLTRRYVGAYAGEHLRAGRLLCGDNVIGLTPQAGGSHAAFIDMLDTENNQYDIAGHSPTTTGPQNITSPMPLVVGLWDIENDGTVVEHIHDPTNAALVTATYNNPAGSALTVNGGQNCSLTWAQTPAPAIAQPVGAIVALSGLMTPPNAVVQGTWQSVISAASNGSATIGYFNNSGATADEAQWSVYLARGTWTIKVAFGTGTANAQVQISLDGVGLGTQETYAAATGAVTATYTGVVVAAAGLHTLDLKVTGKNASSTGFFASPNALGSLAKRTA